MKTIKEYDDLRKRLACAAMIGHSPGAGLRCWQPEVLARWCVQVADAVLNLGLPDDAYDFVIAALQNGISGSLMGVTPEDAARTTTMYARALYLELK